MKKVLFILLISFVGLNIYAQKGAYQNESEATKAERMQWFTDARFGMFIHWGVYCQLDGEFNGKEQRDPKGEWIMQNLKIPIEDYKKEVVSTFNPTQFDAEKWVLAAKAAGMKYIVMTTKHHDGFALFNSAVSDYDIFDATPFKRDIVKELAEMCNKHELRFGIYYSQAQDWYQPGGYKPAKRWDKAQTGNWETYFEKIVKGQVTELLTDYGKISILWWDSGRATQNKKVADKIGSDLVKLQPELIVNGRLGGALQGDFKTYEQVIPATFEKNNLYNELCLTHNRSWSYRASDTDYKSPEFILETLINMASIGGNFLFNVGPKPNGEFPKETYEALDYIGNWLKTNGEAIYGTSKSPFYRLDWGKCTQKTVDEKTKLYFHIFDWTSTGELLIPKLWNKVDKAYLLDEKLALKTTSTPKGLLIKGLPKAPKHDLATVIVVEISEELNLNAGYITTSKNQSFELLPTNALLTIKPQFDDIPVIAGEKGDEYFDNWKNKYPHLRFKIQAIKRYGK
ncbi:MAG: alpha-L-fucosidase [Saprospiraceae bacterium]